MKSIIIFALALVAIAAGVPVEKQPVQILRSELNQEPQGSYSFKFESEDGIFREETGEIKEVLDEEKKPHNVIVVKGPYSYNNE